MAAIDFPAAPAVNQLFTAANGVTYQWNGALWITYGTQGLLSGTALPTFDSLSAMLTDSGTAAFGAGYVMQITHGQQVWSRNFAAVDASHTISVDITLFVGTGSAGGSWNGGGGLFIDGAVAAVAQGHATITSGWLSEVRIVWQGVLAAGPHTFQVRCGGSSLTFLNGAAGNPQGGGALKSTMTITEIGGGAKGPPGDPGAAQVFLQMIDATSGAFQNVPGVAVPWNQTTAMTLAQGQQIYSANITPKSAASRLLVEALINFSSPTQDSYTLGLFRDSGANAIAQGLCAHSVAASAFQLKLRAVIPSVAIAPTTLKLRMGGNGGGAFVINGVTGGSLAVGGGTMFSGLTIHEIA